MGLNISVYKDIKKRENHQEDDDYGFYTYVATDEWLDKIKNLERDTYYDGTCLEITLDYSYGSHNAFRVLLMKLIGRSDLIEKNQIKWEFVDRDLPFYDFVYFSDCEGCLDWEISEVILQDFIKYKEKLVEFTPFSSDGYWFNKYNNWLDIFKQAVENKGVVVFH